MSFISDLDNIVKNDYDNIKCSLSDKVISFEFLVSFDDVFYNKYKLKSDVKFVCNVGNNVPAKMEYYYKGIKVNPDCHYIIPDNYVKVGILKILQECINQDTHSPDIKKFEIPNIKNDRVEKLENIKKTFN